MLKTEPKYMRCGDTLFACAKVCVSDKFRFLTTIDDKKLNNHNIVRSRHQETGIYRNNNSHRLFAIDKSSEGEYSIVCCQ